MFFFKFVIVRLVWQTRVAETLRKCLSWDPTGRRLAVDNDAGLVRSTETK